MHRVVTSEIVRTIFEQREDAIVHLRMNDCRYIRYDYKTFRRDMRVSELLIDERTISDRWSLLNEKGIVQKDRTFDGLSTPFHIDLKIFDSLIQKSDLYRAECARTHTRTHIMHYDSKITEEGAQ